MNSGIMPYLMRSSGWRWVNISCRSRSFFPLTSAPKPSAALEVAVFDHLVQADEGAAADEEDVRGVDPQVFLLRMLAPALGRHVGDGSLDDLEQGLLDAFARDVPGDGDVFVLPGDLVDLVDVDDAALRSGDVAAGVLYELEQDVFDVLAHVASLGQGRGVRDGEGHLELLGQGSREQGLSGASRTDEQDVGLLDLDTVLYLSGVGDALVVVVDGDAKAPSWRTPGRPRTGRGSP